MLQKFINLLVFVLSAGGYIPIAIGGIEHPAEVNVATYGLWTIIVSLMLYGSLAQKYDGWIMPFGWTVGNVSMVLLAIFFLKGWTFNLGPSESVAFFGIIAVVSVWATIGQVIKKWNPRLLYLGVICVDVLSFYPQIKQYLLSHEAPTLWMLLGWAMFFLGAFLNLVFVEKFFAKMIQKRSWAVFEESLLSIENIILLFSTTILMMK